MPGSVDVDNRMLVRLDELGPGGRPVAAGTTEQVEAAQGSYTGLFLAPMLPRAAGRRAALYSQPASARSRQCGCRAGGIAP